MIYVICLICSNFSAPSSWLYYMQPNGGGKSWGIFVLVPWERGRAELVRLDRRGSTFRVHWTRLGQFFRALLHSAHGQCAYLPGCTIPLEPASQIPRWLGTCKNAHFATGVQSSQNSLPCCPRCFTTDNFTKFLILSKNGYFTVRLTVRVDLPFPPPCGQLFIHFLVCPKNRCFMV